MLLRARAHPVWLQVGIDFTPNDQKFRTPSMDGFAYEADPRITGLIDAFVQENWNGVGECR